MIAKLLISLAGALYVAAFVFGGMETVAHTGGDLPATIVCGTLLGLCACGAVGGIAYFAALAVSGWWDWVRSE